MRLLRLEFENFAWKGIRLEGQLKGRSENEPHEFSIGWHHSQSCWDIIEYSHFESGPSRGKHSYIKSWEEVELYFKDYPNNLPSFREYVQIFLAYKVAENV